MDSNKKILELFAGSRSIGKEAEKLGMTVFSSDINAFQNIDYVTDILNFDVTRVPWIPDGLWGSPPCQKFSVAAIGRNWNKDNTPKNEEAKFAVLLVEKLIEIIDYFVALNPDLKWWFENPTGKLRKLPVVQGLDMAAITYCSYGDDRMKPTDIWSNNIYSIMNPNGWVPRPRCFAGNTNCHHEPAPRGSKTGTQGRKGSYERSKIPPELCREILLSLYSVKK